MIICIIHQIVMKMNVMLTQLHFCCSYFVICIVVQVRDNSESEVSTIPCHPRRLQTRLETLEQVEALLASGGRGSSIGASSEIVEASGSGETTKSDKEMNTDSKDESAVDSKKPTQAKDASAETDDAKVKSDSGEEEPSKSKPQASSLKSSSTR